MSQPLLPVIFASVSAKRLDPAALLEQIRRDDCGALVGFEGTVRSPSKGHDVLHLEYEVYDRVVEAQLLVIATEICAEFDLLGVVIAHRVGTVAVGQPAVVAGTVSPHRGAAFAATAKLMDRVKSEAAIWKREVTSDGGTWVEGC